MVNDAGYGTGLPCCSSCVKPLAYDNTIWTALQSHNKLLSSKNTETISVVIGTARTKIKVRRQWRRTWRDDSDHMNDNVWSVEGSNNIVAYLGCKLQQFDTPENVETSDNAEITSQPQNEQNNEICFNTASLTTPIKRKRDGIIPYMETNVCDLQILHKVNKLMNNYYYFYCKKYESFASSVYFRKFVELVNSDKFQI